MTSLRCPSRGTGLLALFLLLSGLSLGHGADPLAAKFQAPPPQVAPWTYWMWLRTPTTPECITRDLEEMKAKGIGGFILYDSGAGGMMWAGRKMVLGNKAFNSVPTDEFAGATATPLPPGPPAWSPEWRKSMRFVAKESARLGLDFCLTIGLAGCSNPQMTPEFGQQTLAWSEQRVTGPQSFDGELPVAMPPASGKKPAPTPPYRRGIAVLAVPVKPGVSTNDVLDITASLDAAGRLRWQAPAGEWRILRFDQVATGIRNAWGYYHDHLSAEAFDRNWEQTMGPLLAEMTPDERKGIKAIEDDSWECGVVGWTPAFAAEFEKRRGYSITRWLPVLAGVTLGDTNTSAQVTRDYRLTISDLIADNHYGHMRDVANRNGLKLCSEAAGPHLKQADLLKNIGRCDVPMAEFWMPSPHRPRPDSRFLVRDAAAAAHGYGLREVMCEAFTSVGPFWEESPFSMKACADQAFCDGLTRVAFHNWSHTPWPDAKPGAVYFAGTFIGRNVTWWEQMPAFNDYLNRCSLLLTQGNFGADVVFYTGDGIGKSEAMKIVPPSLGPGYDYDRCNTEVLLTRMSVKNGRLTLPDGLSYRLLVLPEGEAMAPAALQKLASLVNDGATVVGPRPTGPAGLGSPADFDALLSRLWPSPTGETRVGKGRVISGKTARDVLAADRVPPDFESEGVSTSGEIDWIHRALPDGDLYYVTSRWFAEEKITARFRVSGRQPELWDPVSGTMRDAKAFRQENGRTVMPLEFGPCGSVFVVFRKPIATSLSGNAPSNAPLLKSVGDLKGPWRVAFDPKWGGPADVTFEALTDWAKRPEEGIRFYSGTAVYRKSFDLPAGAGTGRSLWLDLGELHEVAEVVLNGTRLGVVWNHPGRIDITRAVKPRGNALELRVVNLWPNRLIGDAALPPEKRYTRTNMHKFNQSSPLLPSGLVGPVTLLSE